jgi:hypothetical protein
MNIINRTLSKNFSPRNSSPKISFNDIELANKDYVPARKESFGNDSDNGFSDENPLLSQKPTYWQKVKNFYFDNKANVINKMLTITVHIFIMVIFEIYFYFNYVIYLEKDEFMGKIHSYIKDLGNIQLNPTQRLIITQLITEDSEAITSELYSNYIQSLDKQKLLKQELMIVSYKMAGVVGLVLCFFFLWGLLNWKEIKWKSIIIDNILMFVFLGTFEYMFFSNVVLHYNPVTDGEIKYTLYTGLVDYFNQTST